MYADQGDDEVGEGGTKVHNRLLRPLMAARQPQAPPPLRDAPHTIDQHVDDYIDRARPGKAA